MGQTLNARFVEHDGRGRCRQSVGSLNHPEIAHGGKEPGAPWRARQRLGVRQSFGALEWRQDRKRQGAGALQDLPESRWFMERRLVAFTLIELMVVIALIGILSAVIIPEMRGTYEEALLRSTSRQLVNLCNLAYSRAVSMQSTYRLVLDPISGKFVLEKREAGARQGNKFVPAQDVSGSKGELDTRIAISFHRRPTEDRSDNESAAAISPAASDSSDLLSQAVIGFYPDGTSDPAEIQLRDRQGFGLLLRISPVTSRVRVVELPRE